VLLGELSRGNESALDKLLPLVYDELHRLARGYFRGERPDNTLQATALVHEAYLRLVEARFQGVESRSHFVGFAAKVMRRILVDHARETRAQKRGGQKTELTESKAFTKGEEVDVVALDEALSRLEAVDPDQSRVVELRYFGGLSIEETAALLRISEPTVKRRWSSARAWLRRELRRNAAGSTA